MSRGLREATLSVLRIAASQHGVFHVDQAVAAGMPATSVYRRVRAGEWVRIFEKVVAASPQRGDWIQRVAALTLWAGNGAAASHSTAGALWELEGVDPGTVEIVFLGKKRAPAPDVRVHETDRRFTTHFRQGISVTSVDRTLIDLGWVLPTQRLEYAVEDALRRRLTTVSRLKRSLDVEGGRGRNGARALRDLIGKRAERTPPTASWLETRLSVVVKRARLPMPIRQHRVPRPGGRVAFIDFSYPDRRIGIEAEGYEWHSGRRAWQEDRARLNDLTTMGWRILHVTKEDLSGEATMFVATLRRLLGEETLW